jgi:site-specific recombinase XerD
MMDYSLRFRLDVKNNVYVSKKNGSTEPYYQISAMIRINKNREIHYSLGYSAQKSAWFANPNEAGKGDGNRICGIHKNHTAKKKNRIVQYAEVNRAIDLVSGKLLSIANKVGDISKEDLIETLNMELGKSPRKKPKETEPEKDDVPGKDLWILSELYCIDKTVSEGRNKTRRNAMNHFKNFETKRGRSITFPDCNAKLLTDFEVYLKEDDSKNYWHIENAKYRPTKKNRNSISKILSTLKHFFTWVRRQYEINDFGNVRDYKVPPTMYGDPITLTIDEKRQLCLYNFDDKDLELYRDLFVFQCSIGARVSDLFKLKYENLQKDRGKWCIKYLPKKTKNTTSIECRVPLTKNAYSIFKKYKLKQHETKTPLFPFPKNPQTLNKNLKKIFKMAGLDRMVTVYNKDGETEYVPLFSLAQSKFARSCFIDILVGKGETDNIISTMSGHTPGSKAFHRYHTSLKAEQQNRAIKWLD